MAGYGNDPALANARSKVDKNLAGLLGQTDEKTFRYYTYVNASAISNIDAERTVAGFHFATVEETTVTMWHEIQADFTLDNEDTPMQVIVHYYLNGVEEAYTPIMTIGEDGIHTLNYNYFLTGIAGGMRNEWTVTLECVGGSADIDANGIHVCLSGQGLVGEDAFNGLIEASDEIPLFVVKAIEECRFTDSAILHTQNSEFVQPSDNIDLLDVNTIDVVGFTEQVVLYLKIDESLLMRCGDEFYAGEDMATGLYNTLYDEQEEE